MRLEAVPLSDFRPRVASGKFDAFLGELIASHGLSFTYLLWHSTPEPFIRTGYAGADAVLDRVRAARTDDELRQAVHDLQRDDARRSAGRVPLLGTGQPRREPPLRPARRRRRRHPPLGRSVAAGRSPGGRRRGAMKTIRARLAVLVATAAVAPLLAYGVVSLQLLRSATNVSVTGEAETAAEHAAGRDRQVPRATTSTCSPSVASDLQYARPDARISRSGSCATTSRRSRPTAS